MRITPTSCPACLSVVTKVLRNMSPHDDLTYYRCEPCGHVWVVYNDGSTHHVTPLNDAAQRG